MGTRQTHAAQWLGHVQRWRRSGLTRAAYCSREALSLSAFCYWITKSNRGSEHAPPQSLTLATSRAQWLETSACVEVNCSMSCATGDGRAMKAFYSTNAVTGALRVTLIR